MSRSRSCTTPTRPLSRPSPPAWPGPGGSSRPRPLCSMSASSPSARAGRASSSFFGLGTGLAILIDATLVRGVLVPAFMRAFGERSWYAAPLLRRWHERIGVTSTTLRRPLGVSTSAAGRATQARAAAGASRPDDDVHPRAAGIVTAFAASGVGDVDPPIRGLVQRPHLLRNLDDPRPLLSYASVTAGSWPDTVTGLRPGPACGWRSPGGHQDGMAE